jgi:hypothetical protein
MKKAATAFGIGFELIVLVWFANSLGENLNKRMDWENASTYGVVIAFVLWFIHMIFMAKDVMKDEKD